MSLRKHTIAPRGFTAAQAEHALHSDKFPKFTNREIRAMEKAGRVTQLGDSGKVWQLAEDSFAHPNFETGAGRVLLDVSYRDIIVAEMRRRPAWCVNIV